MHAASSQNGATSYTLHEAAQLLGVSLNTVRRKIARGELNATQVARPQGHVWHVWLERTQDAAQHPTQGSTQHPPTEQVPADSLQVVERVDQAEALVRLVHEAVAPVERERDRLLQITLEQAEAIGRLRREIEDLQADRLEIALSVDSASPVVEPTQTSGEAPKTRPWWRVW